MAGRSLRRGSKPHEPVQVDDAHGLDKQSQLADEAGGKRCEPTGPPPLPRQAAAHLSPVWTALWLVVAAAVPVLVAMLGVFARYLQASLTAMQPPPQPPLQLTLLCT